MLFRTTCLAAIQNPAGQFVSPTLQTTTAAVSAGASGGLPAGDASWTSVSLLNTNAADAYPIVTFSYLLVYKELNVIPNLTQGEATAIVQTLWYTVHDGQSQAAPLSYANTACKRRNHKRSNHPLDYLQWSDIAGSLNQPQLFIFSLFAGLTLRL
jgi:hypothetical protein